MFTSDKNEIYLKLFSLGKEALGFYWYIEFINRALFKNSYKKYLSKMYI